MIVTCKEFLFDFTLYKDKDWEPWSLPSVVIEHENKWTADAFFQDFWKLLLAHAPLRVMFGYARERSGVEELAALITKHADKSRWTYPSGVEDLVLLRSSARGGMPWPDWRVIHRPAGFDTWNDLREQPLDGRHVALGPV